MGASPQIGGSTKLSVTGNAECGTGDGATMRPREVKRELIRALAPTAGGLFTGAPWRARELLRVVGAEKQKHGSHRMSDCQQLAAHARRRKANLNRKTR